MRYNRSGSWLKCRQLISPCTSLTTVSHLPSAHNLPSSTCQYLAIIAKALANIFCSGSQVLAALFHPFHLMKYFNVLCLHTLWAVISSTSYSLIYFKNQIAVKLFVGFLSSYEYSALITTTSFRLKPSIALNSKWNTS